MVVGGCCNAKERIIEKWKKKKVAEKKVKRLKDSWREEKRWERGVDDGSTLVERLLFEMPPIVL